MRIEADRERAAGVAREKVLARETEAAVYNAADKHAADITARRNGELAHGGRPRLRERCGIWDGHGGAPKATPAESPRHQIVLKKLGYGERI